MPWEQTIFHSETNWKTQGPACLIPTARWREQWTEAGLSHCHLWVGQDHTMWIALTSLKCLLLFGICFCSRLCSFSWLFFFPCTSVVLNLGNFVLDFLCPHAFQSLMSFRNFVGGIWQMCILVDKSMGTRLRHLLFLSHNFHLFLHLLIPTHQLPPNPVDFYPVYTFSYY